MKLQHLALTLVVGLAVPLASGTDADARPKGAKKVAPKKSLSPNQVAENVQKFYDKTKTFKAGFKQRYIVRAYNKRKDSQGQVIFEKPGKMSWRYTSNGNRVVSDGKIIKVYEADNKQMYEQPLGKSQYPAALAFLVGGGNLKKSFKLRKLNEKQMQFEGGYVLEGVPKEATPAYQKILLYVDANTYQVRRVLLLDAQGNRNRFDFVSPAVNTKVPKNEFAFKPPPGTQVIKP
jgi:outer membrane lipoprotein carrier protein